MVVSVVVIVSVVVSVVVIVSVVVSLVVIVSVVASVVVSLVVIVSMVDFGIPLTLSPSIPRYTAILHPFRYMDIIKKTQCLWDFFNPISFHPQIHGNSASIPLHGHHEQTQSLWNSGYNLGYVCDTRLWADLHRPLRHEGQKYRFEVG